LFARNSRKIRGPLFCCCLRGTAEKIRENGNVHTSSCKVSDFDRIRRK
jgi:hypothetical protein